MPPCLLAAAGTPWASATLPGLRRKILRCSWPSSDLRRSSMLTAGEKNPEKPSAIHHGPRHGRWTARRGARARAWNLGWRTRVSGSRAPTQPTVRFKNELEINITIKLRYANAKIYKREDDKCPRPMCYKYDFQREKIFSVRIFTYYSMLMTYIIHRVYGSGKEDSPLCDVPGFENIEMKLLRHVSFVDCPVR